MSKKTEEFKRIEEELRRWDDTDDAREQDKETNGKQ